MSGSIDQILAKPLDVGDIIAIVVYFIFVLAAGIYAMYTSNRSTVSGYFLAGRFMTWLPVGASMFASNIGSEHFIGLAGSGAASGIAVGAFEFNALLLLQILGWIFLPVYMASKVCTLPEYMSKRFGGSRIRVFLAVLSVLLYVFTKISVNMYAGALFIRQTLGWNLYLSIVLLLSLTAICTVTGGLTAVIYTDTLQFFVMITGGTILMIRAFMEIGGYSELRHKYMEAIPNKTIEGTTCGHPRSDSWTMLRDPVDSDMPWPGFILGQSPASIWYWCADQMMVQRALAAKTLSHAQGATLFTGYIKILPIFMMVIPGMISRVLYRDIVACVQPEECQKYCENPTGCSNLAYPMLVLGLLPSGLRGVMVAVMLAALMSDLTSIFNSSSTLFTIDIWQRIRKQAASNELLLVGKLFIVIMVVISIVWIPIIVEMQGGQLYLYIQAIAAYLSPPIAAIYIMAILWKRMNEAGAFWGLICGFIVGVIRMALDFAYKEPLCGEPDTRPAVIAKVHYMYFATILFWQTIIVSSVIALLTKPPKKGLLIRTTYWTRFDQEERADDVQIDLSLINSASHKTEGKTSDSPMTMTSPEDDDIVPQITFHENGKIKHLSISSELATLDHKNVVELNQNFAEENHSLKEFDKAHLHEFDAVPWWRRFYFWFCGYTSSEAQAHEALALNSHLDEVASLQQDPRAKLFLNINLGIIIAVGISLYIGFSVGG